jgi:hypothetical protein
MQISLTVALKQHNVSPSQKGTLMRPSSPPLIRQSSPPLITGNPKLLPVEGLFFEFPAKPNLLLEGPEPQLEAALTSLIPFLSHPLVTWCGGIPGALPADHSGTLVVRQVDSLDGDQQQRLSRWLDDTIGRVQVIATTSEPLFEMVERGAFCDTLYYRLNVVRVEV